MTKLQKLVYAMLTTNTGIHMMDSGMAEGRHWQQNQKKTIQDFINEPQVDMYTDDKPDNLKSVDYTISVFHYLTNNNKFDLDALCDKYNKLKCNDWDGEYYGVSASQQKWLDNRGFVVEGESFNTYNGDSSLSQVLQGTTLKLDDDTYVLLQVHNGADVRGGYTDAKLFKLVDEYMPIEDVSGNITRSDGTKIFIDNAYNGYSLTDDSGDDVELKEGDKIELYLY